MEQDALELQHMKLPPFSEYLQTLTPALEAQVEQKSELYSLLADERSREMLVLVAAYAILGRLFVKFPYYAPDAIATRTALHKKALIKEHGDPMSHKVRNDEFGLGFALNLYDTSAIGHDLRLYAGAEFLYALMRDPQYVYTTNTVRIAVETGDYVMDCGACFGDMALVFADAVGPSGKVFAFEPHPRIAELCAYNFSLNERLQDSLTLAKKAVSETVGEELSFTLAGPGSSLSDIAGTQVVAVTTTTIDHEVARNNLPRLDFIKMDVEGAELQALRGAVHSIRKFKPNLAISLYHKRSAFTLIPRFIHDLDLGYRFYMNHHYINQWETVLYASV